MSCSLPRLTPTERTLLSHLMTGQSGKQIATAMRISQSTYKFHCRNLYAKFNVQGRVDLLFQVRMTSSGVVDRILWRIVWARIKRLFARIRGAA